MISASEKCLFKNVPISVSLSFSFFFCSFFHLCVNPRPPVRMREQRLTVFVIVSALMEGGWRTLLSTLCFVCPSFFCLSPSAISSVCTSSVSLYVILTAMHNECFFFYCLLLWIIPKAGKSPACPSQPECLDHTLSVWKQPITGPDRPGDWVSEPVHAWGNLGWIWIVFQMSSWINMAIHFKLEEDSNCTLSYLLSRRWFWFFFLL